MRLWFSALLLVTGCATERSAGNWRPWFDEGSDLDVTEPIPFTDRNYDFPAAGVAGVDTVRAIAHDLPGFPDPDTAFGPADAPPAGCDLYTTDDDLPLEIDGIVTLHPRLYFKTDGCVPDFSDGDSDEKYYGSYFIQDGRDGVFVLGDSKVAHFDMGDRIRLRVRAVRDRFDLVQIAAHDVVDVQRGPFPVYYELATQPFGDADVGRVKRVTGTVVREADTFGEVHIQDANGVQYTVTVDVELSRRGLSFTRGSVIQATGPIMFSFDVYGLVLMRLGQVEVLAEAP